MVQVPAGKGNDGDAVFLNKPVRFRFLQLHGQFRGIRQIQERSAGAQTPQDFHLRLCDSLLRSQVLHMGAANGRDHRCIQRSNVHQGFDFPEVFHAHFQHRRLDPRIEFQDRQRQPDLAVAVARRGLRHKVPREDSLHHVLGTGFAIGSRNADGIRMQLVQIRAGNVLECLHGVIHQNEGDVCRQRCMVFLPQGCGCPCLHRLCDEVVSVDTGADDRHIQRSGHDLPGVCDGAFDNCACILNQDPAGHGRKVPDGFSDHVESSLSRTIIARTKRLAAPSVQGQKFVTQPPAVCPYLCPPPAPASSDPKTAGLRALPDSPPSDFLSLIYGYVHLLSCRKPHSGLHRSPSAGKPWASGPGSCTIQSARRFDRLQGVRTTCCFPSD